MPVAEEGEKSSGNHNSGFDQGQYALCPPQMHFHLKAEDNEPVEKIKLSGAS
jgi:hypothetical protein